MTGDPFLPDPLPEGWTRHYGCGGDHGYASCTVAGTVELCADPWHNEVDLELPSVALTAQEAAALAARLVEASQLASGRLP